MPYVLEDSPQPSGRFVLEDAPAAVSAGKDINSIPRQVGLTARYGLEGLANTAQILTEPIRNALIGLGRSVPMKGEGRGDNPLMMERKPEAPMLPLGQAATNFADQAGLPSPQGANERVVGDAARLMAGSGGLGGAAQAASTLPGLAGRAGAFLSKNLGQQLGSAAGAGLAGGSSREAGGSQLQQELASLLGGVAGGMAVNAGGAGIDAGRRLLTPKPNAQQMDAQISILMERAGVDYSQVPERVRQSLRGDLAQAMNTGQELDPAAVRRLADFRMTGLTPTRGAITQDPVQITREMNLAKTGANSADRELQGLARVQNANNERLIQGMNAVGAGTNTEPVAAGRALAGTVLGRQASLRNAEQSAWDAAKGSPAYRQPIYPDALNNINRELGDEGMIGFLNPKISEYMKAFQTGDQPFTPQAYRNLQSMLSNELAKGGNEAAAARIARNALERTQIQPINNPRGVDFGNLPVTAENATAMRARDAMPGQAFDAIDRARGATRAAYAYEGSSPLVRNVLSEGSAADPTRIAQRFIIGGTPDEAATVAREAGPGGMAVIKEALATYIKRQALSGAADEVGKVSQSRLNGVLREIGDEKLRMFFSPEELTQLRALGRVSSYVQVQPVGSAVNNSNTGALLLGRGLDALSGFANAFPVVGPMVAQPLTNGIRNLNIAIQTGRAQNAAPGLLVARPRPAIGQSLLLSGIAQGGLLAAPTAP